MPNAGSRRASPPRCEVASIGPAPAVAYRPCIHLLTCRCAKSTLVYMNGASPLGRQSTAEELVGLVGRHGRHGSCTRVARMPLVPTGMIFLPSPPGSAEIAQSAADSDPDVWP